MDDGPLISALKNSEFQPRTRFEAMSVADMRQLLILMGSITVISFVLVVFIFTILVAFIWYTRRKINSIQCRCHKGRVEQWSGGVALDGHKGRVDQWSGGVVPPVVLDGPRLQGVSAPQATEPQFLQYSSPVLGRPVTPTRSIQPPRLVPHAKTTTGLYNSVIVNPLPPAASPVEVDKEPIYHEIKPASEKERTGEVRINKLEEVPSLGRKKEIEYWQITAKEVVKYRPCTETFINRS